MKYIKEINAIWDLPANRVDIEKIKRAGNVGPLTTNIRVVHDDIKYNDILYFYKDNKLVEEYKKYLIKNKLKIVVDTLEYLANTHRNTLHNLGSLTYYTWKKPINLYLKGGKKVNMPIDVLEVYELTDYRFENEYLYVCSGDKKPVEDINVFHWNNNNTDDIHNIFENGTDVEKMNLYVAWSYNKLDEFLRTAHDTVKENVKFIDTMHNKRYMKDFKRFDGMNKQFGFFDED